MTAAREAVDRSLADDRRPTANIIVPRKDGILYKVGHGDTVDSIVAQYDNITAGTVSKSIILDQTPPAVASTYVVPGGSAGTSNWLELL